MAMPLFAQYVDFSSTGQKTPLNRPVQFYGINAQCSGSEATFVVRDGDADGPVIFYCEGAANTFVNESPPAPIRCVDGIHVTVTGSPTNANGYFDTVGTT